MKTLWWIGCGIALVCLGVNLARADYEWVLINTFSALMAAQLATGQTP